MSATTAVVFAYSEVGARCLAALLDSGVAVPLVVTHEDDPHERRWFRSVVEVARAAGCPTLTPADPADAELARELARLQPDFIVGSSRVDLQACKLEYSIVSPK